MIISNKTSHSNTPPKFTVRDCYSNHNATTTPNIPYAPTGDIRTSDVSEKLSEMADTLGSITKCQSKNQKIEQKHQFNRRMAYAFKNTSAKILPTERVRFCLKNRVTDERGVDVRLNTDTGRAGYGNLMRCDSVWVCPCCAPRILAQRGSEVEKGVDMWTDAGGSVFMLTLTHSHSRTDNLAVKMKLLQKALSRFFGDRAMKEVFKQFGKVGQIKALETTYGEDNGWHPHHHILIFSKLAPEDFLNEVVAVTYDKHGYVQYVDNKREEMLIRRGREGDIGHVTFEHFIKSYWIKICRAVGLGLPTMKRGATFQNASEVRTYLTKFKTAQELTNAQSKQGKNGSRNQWEILADAHKKQFYIDALNSENPNNPLDNKTRYEYQQGLKKALNSEKLWRIYADAFKGQRQLFWSRGLKELLLIDDIDDADIEELEGEKEEEIITVIEVPIIEWNYICRKNWQANLLDIVEDDYKNDTDNLSIFIYSVKKLIENDIAVSWKIEQDRIKNLTPPKWFNDC